MALDRRAAATWSKDRIKEEIADLRRQIADMHREADDARAQAEALSAAIDSGEHPYSRSSDPTKHTDALYDFAEATITGTYPLEDDIEFLKSLL